MTLPVPICVQPEPEDHVGAREAAGGAREAEVGGAGEEPPVAGTHVMLKRTAHAPVHTREHAFKRTSL